MKTFLIENYQLSQTAIELLLSHAKKHTFKKSQRLLSPDKKTDQLFLIEEGFVRGYRIIDGNDVTHHFFSAGNFATDYQGFLTDTNGSLYLEAIIETTVFTFKKHTLFALFKQSHELERLGRLIAEQSYLQVVQRLISLQTQDLEKRYLDLIQHNPALFKAIPQKHIASYLGVRPQSLSRIRKNISDH